VTTGDAAALPAATVLRMATLNGARALGLDGLTGSLEVGKQADLVAVDLGGLAAQPVFDPVSHLVHVAERHDVTDVWIDGVPRVEGGLPVGLDVPALLARAQWWQRKLSTANPS
jgi:5-methylthioadenosine/S-adenosylhomocysteine deaminase